MTRARRIVFALVSLDSRGRRRLLLGARGSADRRTAAKARRARASAAAAGRRKREPCRCWRSMAQDRRRAGLSRRRRHRASAQHRDGAPAGRRQADLDLLHRRPGRPQGLRPRQDRSRHLPGAVRSGGGQEGAGRGDCSPMPSSISSATSGSPPPTRSTSSRSTPSARWSPSSKRRSSPTRPRSTTRAPSCPTPTSSRRSPAAPASGMVDEGNIVRGSDATGIVVITQIKPITVMFNLPQQELPAAQQGHGGRPAADRRARDRTARPVDQRQGAGDRQPGRPDHRHREAQGRIPQRQPAALAGPVRQCAAPDRHPARSWWCRPRRFSAVRAAPTSTW